MLHNPLHLHSSAREKQTPPPPPKTTSAGRRPPPVRPIDPAPTAPGAERKQIMRHGGCATVRDRSQRSRALRENGTVNPHRLRRCLSPFDERRRRTGGAWTRRAHWRNLAARERAAKGAPGANVRSMGRDRPCSPCCPRRRPSRRLVGTGAPRAGRGPPTHHRDATTHHTATPPPADHGARAARQSRPSPACVTDLACEAKRASGSYTCAVRARPAARAPLHRCAHANIHTHTHTPSRRIARDDFGGPNASRGDPH